MSCHANKSLNLLQRIISEGSDSSSGQDWVETEQAVDSDIEHALTDSGAAVTEDGRTDTLTGKTNNRTESLTSSVDDKTDRLTGKGDDKTDNLTDKRDGKTDNLTSNINAKINGLIETVDYNTDRKTDRTDTETDSKTDGHKDNDLCGYSLTSCVMDKMGNTVGGSHESEEEINRKYEQFLRGGQLINDDEHDREVVLDKIEEESAVDSWPVRVNVVTEKSESGQGQQHHGQEENHESFDNRSRVDKHCQLENKTKAESEDSGVRKKTKLRKKKRKVKKAFVMENGDPEECDGRPENGEQEAGEQEFVNQEQQQQHNARCSRREESTDQDSVSDRQEIMSDQGPSTHNQKRRKLAKRTQMRKFRSLDINPNVFYEERLQQKYEELRQLVQTGISQTEVSRQYLRQMELLRQQYASVSHGIPPSGRSVLRDVSRQPHNQQERTESDHAYSTIRILQVTNQQRFSRPRPQSAAPAKQDEYRDSRSRPKSAAPTRHDQPRSVYRPVSGKPESIYSSSSTRNRSYSPRSRRQNGYPESPRSKSADSDSTSDVHSQHHGGFPRTDYHLKNTENEAIKEWLKRKNVLIRKQKAEERKKKREERKKEQAKALEKEEKYQQSKEKVEEWFKAKRLEAIKMKKEEKYYKKRLMEERAMHDAGKINIVSGQGFDYPPAPPLYKTKHVVRPGTTPADVKPRPATELPVAGEETPDSVRTELNNRRLEEEEKQQTTLAQKIQIEGPHPPTTKFVYKRPVLGRVRLRVRQKTPERNAERSGRKEKKIETQVKREEMKLRKSYDEWLAEKRNSSKERHRGLSKHSKMSKSNPELERRDAQREEHCASGIDVNKSYSPAELDELTHKLVSEVLSSVEDEELEEDENSKSDTLLQVSGSKASLSVRPKSASSAPVPSLQMSKSPRRPASAKPHPRAVKENEEHASSPPGLRLPFPPDLGVPKYVESRQRKLFSPKLWENPEDSSRPEPQGCDATDQKTSGVTEESARDKPVTVNSATDKSLTEDSVRDRSTGDYICPSPHDSQRYKRVSFSETTTVIEEDLPSTDSPSTDAASSESPAPDVQDQALPNDNSDKQETSDSIFLTQDS